MKDKEVEIKHLTIFHTHDSTKDANGEAKIDEGEYKHKFDYS